MNSINSQGLHSRIIPIAISVIAIFVFIFFTSAISYGEAPFFSIALSKFSDEEAAKNEETKLKNAGNNAFYKKEKNPANGNIEYQVYIEKYSSMDEAIKEAKVLKELEIISDYLVKEVVDKPIEEEIPTETPPEGSEIPQPAFDTKQIPGTKTEVIEKKEPEHDLKIAEDKAPLAAKKDVEIKTPVTAVKESIKSAAETESKKVEASLPIADKKEVEKKRPEPAPKEQLEKPLVPEQGKASGQIKREPIPVKKDTLKQAAMAEKPAGQPASTVQNVANENVLKPENVESQKKAPEPTPLKDEAKPDVPNAGAVHKTIPKEAPQQIKRVETIPVKPEKATAKTPAANAPAPEKEADKKEPVKIENTDQAKGETLQVGACKEEANAAILKKQLISLGRAAFYRHETAEGMGEIYRVYITGYKTLGDAVKDAKTLVESGVITGYARVHSGKIPAAMPPQKADVAMSETGGRIFFLHTGSFKEEVNAQRVVASLKESGYKAFYVPEKEPSVIWFRVYIGDFRSEAQARETGLELLDKGVITYFKPIAINPQEKGN